MGDRNLKHAWTIRGLRVDMNFCGKNLGFRVDEAKHTIRVITRTTGGWVEARDHQSETERYPIGAKDFARRYVLESPLGQPENRCVERP